MCSLFTSTCCLFTCISCPCVICLRVPAVYDVSFHCSPQPTCSCLHVSCPRVVCLLTCSWCPRGSVYMYQLSAYRLFYYMYYQVSTWSCLHAPADHAGMKTRPTCRDRRILSLHNPTESRSRDTRSNSLTAGTKVTRPTCRDL